MAIARAAAGDDDTATRHARVEAMLRDHRATLLWIARRWSGSAEDADDALQRAMEIYVRRLETIDAATEFAWLKVVVLHTIGPMRARFRAAERNPGSEPSRARVAASASSGERAARSGPPDDLDDELEDLAGEPLRLEAVDPVTGKRVETFIHRAHLAQAMLERASRISPTSAWTTLSSRRWPSRATRSRRSRGFRRQTLRTSRCRSPEPVGAGAVARARGRDMPPFCFQARLSHKSPADARTKSPRHTQPF